MLRCGHRAERRPSFEVRVLTALNILEYNISNGGWAQFLTNCLHGWRGILDAAQAGYFALGATAQSEAVDKLRALCARDEAARIAEHESALGLKQKLRSSQDYMRRIDEDEDSSWQDVLCFGDVDYSLAWIEKNASFFVDAVEVFYGRKVARMTTRINPSETYVLLDAQALPHPFRHDGSWVAVRADLKHERRVHAATRFAPGSPAC